MRELGFKEEDVDEIMSRADKNSNGMIDYQGKLCFMLSGIDSWFRVRCDYHGSKEIAR